MKKKSAFSLLISLLIFGILGWAFLSNRSYPNIYVGSLYVGSLTRPEITKKLRSINKPQGFILVWGTSRWVIPFAEVDFVYDIPQTVDRIFSVNLSSKPKSVGSSFIFNTKLLDDHLASISAYINIPAQDPEVNMINQQIIVSRGEDGIEVKTDELKQKIYAAASNLDNAPIEIPVKQLRPSLNDEQVQQLSNKAKKYADKKIKLTLADKRAEMDSSLIISLMNPNGWNRDKLNGWVSLLASNLDTPAQSAQFHFIPPNKVEEFLPGKDGVKIDQVKLSEMIVKSLDTLEDISVPYQNIPSLITTESVNDLGIKELLGRGESYYSDSISNRIFNVAKAAATINGILIPPGVSFSFNKYVGDISAETGYKQAYIIKEGKTVLGDGGGVCQVSSTLFRAALAAGLPIVERLAHAYRVHYYEEKSQPGLDATVFAPSVDFKFTNDTGKYILIQSTNQPEQHKLVFEIYGTSDGRTSSVSQSRIWDIAAPPPDLYVDDPTLPKGVVKQVDWKAWGAKVAFDWKVVRNGEILQERTFYSNYKPWQAIYLKGTK